MGIASQIIIIGLYAIGHSASLAHILCVVLLAHDNVKMLLTGGKLARLDEILNKVCFLPKGSLDPGDGAVKKPVGMKDEFYEVF